MRQHLDTLTSSLGGDKPILIKCDVSRDSDVIDAFNQVSDHFLGEVDTMCHSIASASLDSLKKPFVELSRSEYLYAHEISAYSLISTTRGAHSMMKNGGSIMTLSYLGSEMVRITTILHRKITAL